MKGSLVAAIVTWGMLCLSAGPAPAEQAGKPLNVVIITADTLRADPFGFAGHPEVKTPRLDALAAEGVAFMRAYTNITTTTPSHATLFTSLYPIDHQAYSNTSRISEKIVTLPEILKQHGWHTASIVNMPWLNPDKSHVVQGTDEVARCEHIRKADKTNRWVLPFLDRQKGAKKPFYLWVHYVDNHTPYHAPGKYERMYYPAGKDPRAGKSGSLQEVWKYFPTHHQDEPFFKKWLRGITDVDFVIASNKGSVSWIDEKVGELIDRLKANGQWDDTLFVFTSDHGESLGEHQIWFAHSGLFETTARVPLIVRMPGAPAGKKIHSLAQLADVMPTVLARLGLPAPDAARGRDLWASLSVDRSEGTAVYLDHAGHQLEGVVTPRYKYIRHLKSKTYNPGYPLKKGTEELYDLSADPGETRNLAQAQPEVLKRMRALVTKLKGKADRSHKAGEYEVDRDTEEMLRSLGYTQ